MSRAAGYRFGEMAASIGIADMQEMRQRAQARGQSYADAIRRSADLPWSWISDAHLGLGRILREWNDLDAAWEQGQKGLGLARQLQNTDRPAACQVLLAHVKLAQGDLDDAACILAEAERLVLEHDFGREAHEVAAARAMLCLRRGDVDGAARLAAEFDLPLVRDPSLSGAGRRRAALSELESIAARPSREAARTSG